VCRDMFHLTYVGKNSCQLGILSWVMYWHVLCSKLGLTSRAIVCGDVFHLAFVGNNFI
jgi:hypothetical protein